MELCATNHEQVQLQFPSGDPDDVHITSSVFDQDLAQQKPVTTKLLKADLSKCVVNSQGDLLESFPASLENESLNTEDPPDKEEVEDVKSMLEMFNILHAKKRVKYEALVLNRDSFSRTAANILTLSLLVKDGRAEVKTEKDSTHFIVPGNVITQPTTEDSTGFLYHFTHKEWQRMQLQVRAGDELMSKSPVVIPKGIRKKARKRTVFNKAPSTVNKSSSTVKKSSTGKLEVSVKPGDEVKSESKKGEDEFTPPDATAEMKPPKPLLTYSRRQKTKTEVSSLQLLKRYTRGGYARTKTLLLFEELISTESKAGDEAETIFERLARAPRRRRTGCPGAAPGETTTTGAPSSQEMSLVPVEDNKLKADGEEVKPVVIAPKRFKKSAFAPRQALVARIKARLKAILKHQAVPPGPKK